MVSATVLDGAKRVLGEEDGIEDGVCVWAGWKYVNISKIVLMVRA